MQFIDKSILEDNGKNIINNLLNDCWDEQDIGYKAANYHTLSKPEYRRPLLQVLLLEQKEVCCYCMKELIKNHTTTLEHIIPHHCSKDDFDSYTTPLLVSNVLYLKDFDIHKK